MKRHCKKCLILSKLSGQANSHSLNISYFKTCSLPKECCKLSIKKNHLWIIAVVSRWIILLETSCLNASLAVLFDKWFAQVVGRYFSEFYGRSGTSSPPQQASAPLLRLWSRKSTVGVPGHRGFMEIPCLGEGQPITLSPLQRLHKRLLCVKWSSLCCFMISILQCWSIC